MTRFIALAVALGGLAEVGAQLVVASRVPSDAEWKAAAKHVRASHRTGDGIVFAPEWVDPIGRLHLGDLVPVGEAARPDRSRQGRIWEISTRGAEHPSAKGQLAETRIFGNVRVRLLERQAARVLFDFTESEPTRRRVGEIDFVPYDCIHASPGEVVEFDAVPIGRSIAISGGIHDFASRYQSDAPVTLEVTVDGSPVARESFGNDGWRRTVADTSRFNGRQAFVQFRVTATKPKARTFCFHAEVHR